MANTLLTISMITREALRVLENSLTFTKFVTRTYDDRFAVSGAKIGDTLRIRKPPKYVVTDGATLVKQDTVETEVSLTLSQKHVGMTFTGAELTLDIDDFSDRIIKPAVAPLANRIDQDGMALFLDVPNIVGTVGTTPATLLTYLLAGVELDNEASPRDDMRSMVINPIAEATIVDSLKGLFHSSTEIERQYKEGRMGMTGGFKWSMDQNVGTHTAGTHTTGSTPLTAGAGEVGASLATDGWVFSTLVLKKGDVITIGGTFAANPQSKLSTGTLRNFVVTADVTSDGAGLATIPIFPSIDIAGGDQNVVAAPGDGAVITPFGGDQAAGNNFGGVVGEGTTTPQNMAFHRDAFAMASADLQIPQGVDIAGRVSDRQLGISLSLVRDYDINDYSFPTRIDVLFGWVTQYPELVCRING